MSASPSLSSAASVHQQSSDRLPWQEQQAPRLHTLGRAAPKTTIRFKCVDCGRQMEARSQDAGIDTNCPHCSAPLTVPRLPANPYVRPIKHVVRQMKAVPFPFPYVPQVIQLTVLTGMLLLFAALFVTIGLVSQIAGVFRGLIVEAQKHLREGSPVERSAQAVSIGIFSVLFVPFWLIQLPFSLIGSLWSSHRLGALVATALLLFIIYALTLYSPYLIRFLHSF